MIASEIERITRVIQSVEPRARLVPRRLLQRVIRRHFDLSPGARAPHDLVFELPGSLLQALLGENAGGDRLESIILLPLPEDDDAVSTEQALADCWRSLFHAAVDRAVDRNGGAFADNRKLFNATVLHEIRTVLEAEHRLIANAGDASLFREFAAFFLELHYFAPHLVELTFPGLPDPAAVTEFLQKHIDAQAIYLATRLGDAPERHSTEKRHIRIRALEAIRKGNDVRAAICYRQLHETANADEKLRSLVQRLRQALHGSEPEANDWFEALQPILNHAAMHGYWDVAERLLYELQKACLDVERKTYSADIVEWLVSFGQQSIKRLLVKPTRVNVLRRLRAASKHLERLDMAESNKQRLRHRLQHAMHATEKLVRDDNRPILNDVLDEVGIVSRSLAERISRNKMVEELLDTLCARGFLKMSDLRDALARCHVKLNDLTGPKEFLLGDPIIRANRKLAVRMDGIYRRGEIYMRGLQRLSSLGFGTKIGRLLVLWLILPFAASFVILSGIHEIGHVLGSLAHWLVKIIIGGETAVEAAHTKPLLTSSYAIGLFGLFLLGLIHLPTFRRQVAVGSRRLFVDLPSAIYHSPLARSIFINAATRFFARYLFLPSLVGTTIVVLMRSLDYHWEATLLVGGGSALLTGTFFRTPIGRNLEERFDESFTKVWRIISVNFVIGMLTLFLQFFRWLFEWMERGMYAVDEWLRFQEGQGRGTLAFKLVFGLFWFFFTYLFRFAWNLLIEPQINPIKHFPVVTVSHKLILPLSLPPGNGKPSPLAQLFMDVLGIPADPTNPAELAKATNTMNAVAGGIVWGIPGIFGFLVWELKENWRLYRANHSAVIGSIPVGSHGERIRGLLRPGFHSGVVPKTFAKLRKAETVGNHKKAAKHHHHLEHVAEAVERLVERETIAYLRASRRWGGLPIRVERIGLATNRIRIMLTNERWEGRIIVSIEERAGWLIGSLEEVGWLSRLNENQHAAFMDVLTELYKLCGIHVLREQAAALLGIEGWRVDCRAEGLLVLPKECESPVAIDYTDATLMIADAPVDGRTLPPMKKSDLVFSDCRLKWDRWVERWEQDQNGKSPGTSLLDSQA